MYYMSVKNNIILSQIIDYFFQKLLNYSYIYTYKFIVFILFLEEEAKNDDVP